MSFPIEFVLSDRVRRDLVKSLCATRLAPCAEDAEDLIQDASLKLLETPEPPADPEKYFMTTIRNLAVDRIRYRRQHPVKSLESSDVPSSRDGDLVLSIREFMQFLFAEIAALPKEQCDAMTAYLVEGRSVEQIAEESERKAVSVYELLRKSGRKLGAALQSHPDFSAFSDAFYDGWLRRKHAPPEEARS